MKHAMLVMIAWMVLSGCAFDYRQPIDVGMAIGAPMPAPIHAVGPPPWAPAHGYRAPLHQYYYYPDSSVYYNPVTSTYFYMNRGAWRFGLTLPAGVVINPNAYVGLQLATSRPYLFYDEHRAAYRGWNGPVYGGYEFSRVRGYGHGYEHGRGHGHGHRHGR